MERQNIKVIIFDVDGVLIHSKDTLGNYLWHKNIQFDLGLSPDQFAKIYSGNWPLVMKGFLSMQKHLENIFTELNVELSVENFIDYWLKNDLRINTEIIPVIQSIKGQRLYIGTNQDSLRAAVLKDKFGQYFDGMFASYHIGFMKPEPGFFKHIESNLGVQANNIAFIDDSLSLIQAATQLGWKCHHYQNIDACKDFIQKLQDDF